MPTQAKINKLVEFLQDFNIEDFRCIEYCLRYAPAIYQDFDATNASRTAKVQAVIDVFYDDTPETDVTDLLADARHYCDAHGLDFADLDRRAYNHYIAETDGERRAGDVENSG